MAESHPRGSFNYFYGAFLLGFLGPIILIFLILRPCLIYLRNLPCVLAHPLLLLLLSRFSHVRLCVTPETEAHQIPLSLGFSRQELLAKMDYSEEAYGQWHHIL